MLTFTQKESKKGESSFSQWIRIQTIIDTCISDFGGVDERVISTR